MKKLSIIALSLVALAASTFAQVTFTPSTPQDLNVGPNAFISKGQAENLRNLIEQLVAVPDGDVANSSYTDGVSNGTTTFTSVSAAFTSADVGKNITGTNIPSGTTIASVTNGTTVVLSKTATGSGTALSFVVVGRSSNTITVDTTKGTTFGVVIKGNRNIVLSGHSPGSWIYVLVAQDATGSRIPTWDAAIHWPGGTAPTLTTTANKIDMFRFLDTGTSYLGSTGGLSYAP